MVDENQEVAEEETVDVSAEIETADPSAGEPSVEDRARQMGWKPEDEYRGPDGKWIPAEDFVKRGEEELPILRNELRKVQAELHKTQNASASFIRMQAQAEMKRAQQRMADAVRTGDAKAHGEALADYEASKDVVNNNPESTNNGGSDLVSAQQAFYKDNDWYGTNEAMKRYADAESQALRARGITDPAENLRKTAENTKKAFNYGKNKTNQAPHVEGGARPPARGQSRKKTWDSMPDDVKRDADMLIKNKITTKEKFAETYWESQNA